MQKEIYKKGFCKVSLNFLVEGKVHYENKE